MQNSVAADDLKALIERIERLEEEKAALASDIRDVYSEAKAKGFDTKILRKIVGIRKKIMQNGRKKRPFSIFTSPLSAWPDQDLAQAEPVRGACLMAAKAIILPLIGTRCLHGLAFGC